MMDMLAQCTSLNSLTLGTDFEFQSNCNLTSFSNPWVKLGTSSPAYTSSELMAQYDGSTMSGTYVRSVAYSVSLRVDDEMWANNDMQVALYQGGVEVYSYSEGAVSESTGTISWFDINPGTYDVYASMDSEHITTLVDTGQDLIVDDTTN